MACSAFFSGSETAFFSLQRVRVEQMVKDGVKGSARLSRLIQRPDRLLSLILLGNNLVNTAAAALATALAMYFWGTQGILIATISLTILLLIFSETTPKTIANRHAERLAISFTRPIELLIWVFTPVVYLLSWIASLATRLVGGTPVPRSLVSDEEIRTMITVGHREGTVEEAEAKLLNKVFDFGDRPVREVMIPRTEVVWVESGTRLVDFMKIYADRTHHGKEEHILFETLTDMDLSTEDRSLMKELIADHVRFRNMTDNLVSLKNVFIKGRKENLSEIVETMDMLVRHYPEHVRKEEERFFPASLGYLSEEKQKLILAQFWDYDKNMIHIKYTQVVTKLLETSQR